jgi:drug/metabolite transporter (DMT)-like permease
MMYVYGSGKQMPKSLQLWGTFLIMGALNNLIPFSLIVWGQQYIESSLASILNATTPIFSVMLAHFLTRDERLTLNRGVGIVLGWVGVSVLIGMESLRGFGFQAVGQVAILGAACSYACAAIYGRRFKSLPPVVVATGMLICTTIMMLPFALIFEQPWTLHPNTLTWGALIALSCLSTAVAYIIYFRVLSTAGATNLMLVTFLIPISAILLGVFILDEQLTWNAFGGMMLIFSGLIAIDGRLISKLRKKAVWLVLSSNMEEKHETSLRDF